MVPAVGLFRGPGACPDLGAFFRGIFLGHIGGHVEQNSVCRDTNAVDERNQPHLVFWLYFIIFLQYFPLFFRISLPPWGALLSPGREGGARIPGSTYPSGGRGCSEASGRSAPRPACPAGSPFLPRNGEKEGRGSTPGPPFLWPARCHSLVWGLWRIVPVVGLFRHPSTCPDLETFFLQMLFEHIFSRKCVPNRS